MSEGFPADKTTEQRGECFKGLNEPQVHTFGVAKYVYAAAYDKMEAELAEIYDMQAAEIKRLRAALNLAQSCDAYDPIAVEIMQDKVRAVLKGDGQ